MLILGVDIIDLGLMFLGIAIGGYLILKALREDRQKDKRWKL